jgi:DnaJ like chaperone protein|tara:strand:+ start:1313 stop:1996 length:684 start_codon:yes stop_codon:yes gene_type:complete
MNKWLFGGLGWALGGPLGAIMGYAIGSITSKNSNTQRGDFGAAMLVLFAAVMKADGKLRKTELEFVKIFFIENFGVQYAQEIMPVFKKILNQNINTQDICKQIKTHMDMPSKLQLIHILFGLSKADNQIHKNEINIITEISDFIGINQSDFKSIQAMFVKDTKGAYEILGVNQSQSNDEIKNAYRKMAIKYHPDKVAHLGQDFSKFAEEKFKSINDAYQKIKKERDI